MRAIPTNATDAEQPQRSILAALDMSLLVAAGEAIAWFGKHGQA
jgi:hypothetical protein